MAVKKRSRQFELTATFTGYKRLRVVLSRRGRELDRLDIAFHANLDTLLLEAVDTILKRNRIDKSSFFSCSVGGIIDKASSAYKIAKIWVAAIQA